MASTVISPEPEVLALNQDAKPTPATPSPAPEHRDGSGYSAENITVLEGLAAVRLRPAMYIGSTGELGLHHLVYEVVDNSVDEALAGYATRIDVTIHVDNSITVVDNGRGIPVDDMVTNGEKMPAVQVVLTKLHAGGKFDASNYKVSGGLHGVGVSCVNALSEELDVEIWRDGFAWEQDYAKGAPIGKLRRMKPSKQLGTKVHFLPDRSIFAVTEFNYDTLAQRLRELAFLNKGLEITLTDERTTDAKTGEIQAAALQVRRRNRRVHQAPQPRQTGAARQAHLHGGGARRRRHGDWPAVQRRLLRDGLHLRQQHQHGGRRHAPLRLQDRAHPHHQRRRAVARPLQGREGKPLRRRCARGPGGRHLGQALAAAVRGPDQGQAQLRHRRNRAGLRQRAAGRVPRAEPHRRPQDHQQGHRRRARARGGTQGSRPHPAQGRARRRRPARQALRLLRAPARPLRTLPRRRRIRRRHRQAGPRPPLPGHPSAQGQDPQRRKGPLRQDARPRRDSRHDHRARLRHRQGRLRCHQAALRQADPDDRCRCGRLAHPHPAAHLLLPPHDRAHQARPRLHCAAAALQDQEGPLRAVHQGRARVRAGHGQARLRRNGPAPRRRRRAHRGRGPHQIHLAAQRLPRLLRQSRKAPAQPARHRCLRRDLRAGGQGLRPPRGLRVSRQS